jgi:anti-sigma factor RsiW
MKACPEYRESLLMDVHGELDGRARPEWETHLRTCTACQEERIRLANLIGRLRGTMSPPPLPQAQTERLVHLIQDNLAEGRREGRWWRRPAIGRPLVPALASLCVLVIAVSLFTMRTPEGPSGIQIAPAPKAFGELAMEDLEILGNLDLLQDMDWVQRLVQAIDEADDDIPGSEAPGEREGMIRGRDKGAYA